MPYRTRFQRAKIYRYLIERIEVGCCFFLCIELSSLTDGEYYCSDPLLKFPELWAMRPTHVTEFNSYKAWSDIDRKGMALRKEALIQALACCF